ncbi:prolyl oligopeptidase family serine peptidase [Paenarthrobacter sp. NPDC089989]|uniref:prolyl oligopeptidase family serine peptidase n=1 Tax=unclassified Paenarthrobacter TaxID=2634190 RepID=UPI0037F2F1C9
MSIPGTEDRSRFRRLLERWDRTPRQGLPQTQSGRAAYTWRGPGEEFPSVYMSSEAALRAAWHPGNDQSPVGAAVPVPAGSVVRGFTLSPDGRRIAALLSTPHTELADLWILAEDTAPIRVPGTRAWYAAPAWHPSGQKLWLLAAKPPEQRLVEVNLNSLDSTGLSFPPALSKYSGARLSLSAGLSAGGGFLGLAARTPGGEIAAWRRVDSAWHPAEPAASSRLTMAGSDDGTHLLLDGFLVHTLSPAEHVTAFSLQERHERDVLWIQSASPDRPSQVFCLDVPPVGPLPHGVPAASTSPFVHLRFTAQASDGVEIPLTVSVRKRDLDPSGRPLRPMPLILTCYGGFGVKHRTEAEPSVPAWLEAGGVFVAAHLRGGGELGKDWHEAGRGSRKIRTILDLIDVAEFLSSTGWTSRLQTVAFGASHGGLVATAAALLSPQTFAGVVAVAPLLDAADLGRHGLGTQWLHEFGADGETTAHERKAISPLHLQRTLHSAAAIPPMLCCILGRDERVDNTAAVEFTQGLLSRGGRSWLLSEDNGGHGQRSSGDVHELSAAVLAFAATVATVDT